MECAVAIYFTVQFFLIYSKLYIGQTMIWYFDTKTNDMYFNNFTSTICDSSLSFCGFITSYLLYNSLSTGSNMIWSNYLVWLPNESTARSSIHLESADQMNIPMDGVWWFGYNVNKMLKTCKH